MRVSVSVILITTEDHTTRRRFDDPGRGGADFYASLGVLGAKISIIVYTPLN